jgi:hypothetical protein
MSSVEDVETTSSFSQFISPRIDIEHFLRQAKGQWGGKTNIPKGLTVNNSPIPKYQSNIKWRIKE